MGIGGDDGVQDTFMNIFYKSKDLRESDGDLSMGKHDHLVH